ncbi:MAG: ATP-binding protein [Burkholderiales bacterium]|nr:ATP-binding protein [Burkholderiales bacterium]
MQKERLIIKNFFILKDVGIELGKYNIFIGEQASGKSLIIKLLHFFREILTSYLPHLPKETNDLSDHFYYKFYQIFSITEPINGTICYSYDKHTIEINLTDKKIIFSESLQVLFNHCVVELEKNDLYPKGNIKIIRAKTQNGTLLSAISETPSENLKLQQTFIPAGRIIFYSLLNNLFNVLDQQININPLLIEFGQNYQRALSSFRSISNNPEKINDFFENLSSKVLKGMFVYDNLGGYIKNNSFDTRLSDASSGQQEFLPVYIILRELLAFGQGNLYIEEPEAHLYPSAQKAITELLVYVTNATNSDGLYITTHSPYILTVLNNLILANDVKDKQTLFDKDLLLPFEEVRAYYIADGGARDLRDHDNRLILADNLDKVSEQTALDFDKLLDLKYE